MEKVPTLVDSAQRFFWWGALALLGAAVAAYVQIWALTILFGGIFLILLLLFALFMVKDMIVGESEKERREYMERTNQQESPRVSSKRGH